VPRLLRGGSARLMELLGGSAVRNHGFGQSGLLAKTRWQAARLLHFAARDISDAYLHFITAWPDPRTVAPRTSPDPGNWEDHKTYTVDRSELMMLHDSLTYLPDCVLAKVDRASMASSLETRVPLLDHRVVEHAWTIPHDQKCRDGVGKWCLRQVLYRHVPRDLVDRPKFGFGAPLAQWLRGPLRDWAQSLLSADAVERWGVLDSAAVTRLWHGHLTGSADTIALLCPLLMLQAWMQESRSAPPKAVRRPATAKVG
jgi:asparagine synthase (glutamine-hydrolysing)